MASPVLKDRLISLVIKWPTLWDRNSLSYSEPSWKKAKAWEVIAKELNMEGQADWVNKLWKHMRDHYVRKKKIASSGSRSKANGCGCVICRRLKFLDEYIVHRRKRNSSAAEMENDNGDFSVSSSGSPMVETNGYNEASVYVSENKFKPSFSASFEFEGKPFVEIKGDFRANARAMRGILHNVLVYLQKKDNHTDLKFNIFESNDWDDFDSMCLTPLLQPFYKREVPQSNDMSSEPFVNDYINVLCKDDPGDPLAFGDVKMEDTGSCFEPTILLDESSQAEVRSTMNGLSDVFSKSTFEPDPQSNSDVMDDDDEGSDDDFEEYFRQANEKDQLKRLRRRAKDKARMELMKTQRRPPPSLPDSLLQKRIENVKTLLPSWDDRNEEFDRLKGLFLRNKLADIFDAVKDLLENPMCMYRCLSCEIGIEGKENYLDHIRQCKPGPDVFYCMFCEQIRTEEEFYGHVRCHFYDDTCVICDIPMIRTFEQHRDLHLPAERFTDDLEEHEKARYTCRLCELQEKLFKKDRFHFRRHLVWSHSNPGQCEMCGMNFQSHSKLRFHKKSAHFVPFDCQKCGERLTSFTHMRRHCCGNETRICEICGKTLKRHQMGRHLKEVHEIGGKTYKCDYCDATFPRIFPLK
ncbi:uncharacterized protein LOC136026366 isoform X2 [Artemia franciscana]